MARQILCPSTAKLGVPRELAVQHIISTIDTILGWSLDQGRNLTASEVDALFVELVSNGLPEVACAPFTARSGRADETVAAT